MVLKTGVWMGCHSVEFANRQDTLGNWTAELFVYPAANQHVHRQPTHMRDILGSKSRSQNEEGGSILAIKRHLQNDPENLRHLWGLDDLSLRPMHSLPS